MNDLSFILTRSLELLGSAAPIPLPEARRALEAGDPATALASARTRLAARPDDPWAWLLLADALAAAGDPEGARTVRQELAGERVPNATFHQRLANGLRASGLPRAAAEHYERAWDLAPERGEIACNLGTTLALMGRHAAALPWLERALELIGEHPLTEAALAAALEATNRLAAAEGIVERLLGRHPTDEGGRLVAALLLRRRGRLDEARTQLEELARTTADPALLRRAKAELVLVLDRSGEPREALRLAREARTLALDAPEASRIDRQAYPQLLERVRGTLDRVLTDSAQPGAAPAAAQSPVFVVGFPRSGTTLVEHVLGALPCFATSDEEPLIDRLVRSLRTCDGRAVDYPADLEHLGPSELDALRHAYYAAAGAIAGAAPRFVDKNPWNLLHLPFIRRLFPASPIVVVLRDPRDACLSAFLQDFRPNVATVQLMTLEGAAATCRGLLDAWIAMRDRLAHMEVRYEDLVDDFEAQARRLVSYVGAEWDEGILEFHATASGKGISTPSRADVSQPISARSVRRWESCADELASVLPLLDPLLEPLGYTSGPKVGSHPSSMAKDGED